MYSIKPHFLEKHQTSLKNLQVVETNRTADFLASHPSELDSPAPASTLIGCRDRKCLTINVLVLLVGPNWLLLGTSDRY